MPQLTNGSDQLEIERNEWKFACMEKNFYYTYTHKYQNFENFTKKKLKTKEE